MNLRAWFERKTSPGYGTCEKCRRPWRTVHPHEVTFHRSGLSERRCFALCEGCWKTSHQDERLAYFFKAYEAHWADGDFGWPTYRDAVIFESMDEALS